MENIEKPAVVKEGKKEIMSLGDFLISPDLKYDRIIEATISKQEKVKESFAQDADLAAQYAKLWTEMSERSKSNNIEPEKREEIKHRLELLSEKLRGEILVDLGGGSGLMKGFAKEMGVSVYILADPHLPDYPDKPIDPLNDLSNPTESDKDMQTIKLKADALDFTRRLPPNSVNFTINGMDLFVFMRSVPYPHRHYITFLKEEVIRATKEGGIIFGSGTTIIDEDSKNEYLSYPKEQRVRELKLPGFEKKIFIKENQ